LDGGRKWWINEDLEEDVGVLLEGEIPTVSGDTEENFSVIRLSFTKRTIFGM
jgi:hypothetical protein